MGVLRYKMHHSDGFSLKVAFFSSREDPLTHFKYNMTRLKNQLSM